MGEQCTQAASAQFRKSKRISVTFMNDRFGGRMPPLVLLTVHKPRTVEAWDHAYNANLIDVTPQASSLRSRASTATRAGATSSTSCSGWRTGFRNCVCDRG